MIKLYGFGEKFGLVDASPFVVKVDLFLRVSALTYEPIADFKSLKKSPKEKLPFIEDDGIKIGDSSFILKYLSKKHDIQLDTKLSDEQKATAYLYTKALDDSLYWCLMYSRWVSADTWPLLRLAFFSDLPRVLKFIVPSLVKKNVIKSLHLQGLGRHSHNELLGLTDTLMHSLSDVLAENDYFFGDTISNFDIVAYAHLCQFISVNFDNEFNLLAKKYNNLVNFCQRIEKQFY